MTQLDKTQMKNLGQLSGIVLGGAALASGGAAAMPYLVPGTLGGNIIGSTAFGTALNEAIKYGTGKTMGEHAVNAARYLGIPQNEWVNYGIQMIGDMPVYMGAEPVAAAASRAMPTVKTTINDVVNGARNFFSASYLPVKIKDFARRYIFSNRDLGRYVPYKDS